MDFFKSNRRSFLRRLSGLGVGLALPNQGSHLRYSERPIRANYMGDFAAPKLETVKIAFIGVGARGSGHASQFAFLEGTEVVAISDLYHDLAIKAKDKCIELGKGERHQNIKLYHENRDSWMKMLEETRPDAVVISTPWELHAQMAVKTMQAGAHAFLEVPMAVSLEDHWEVVNVSERTGKHCMMMENVNYGREELMYLNMCRQGAIGELLHGEAAYIHELRFQMEEQERGTGSWRTPHYAKRNGNLYPTHGLGPVAQYMNLARGEDNFDRIVSFSSPARGRNIYSKKNYGEDHKWNALDYQGGDMNTSIIKTTYGKTIMVQWDETSPRPYSRLNLIQGTKGALAGYPTRVALEGGVAGGPDSHHQWAEGDHLAEIWEKYEHPLYKRVGELATKMGGHGGMDFIMRFRIIECLRNGEPLDQNVYEGAFWSAVAPLSEASIKLGGSPQLFPDFTRGNWKDTNVLSVVS